MAKKKLLFFLKKRELWWGFVKENYLWFRQPPTENENKTNLFPNTGKKYEKYHKVLKRLSSVSPWFASGTCTLPKIPYSFPTLAAWVFPRENKKGSNFTILRSTTSCWNCKRFRRTFALFLTRMREKHRKWKRPLVIDQSELAILNSNHILFVKRHI